MSESTVDNDEPLRLGEASTRELDTVQCGKNRFVLNSSTFSSGHCFQCSSEHSKVRAFTQYYTQIAFSQLTRRRRWREEVSVTFGRG